MRHAAPGGFGLITVLQLFFLYVPLAIGGAYMLVTLVPALHNRLSRSTVDLTSSALYIDALVLSLLLFFGFVVVGTAVMFTVPRLLNLVVKPDKVYPLYGFHYSAHRAIGRMTNIKFFTWLFGDSSYIVHYLRGIGYDLSRVEQTGSNFGTEVQHETPFLCSVGSGTMVADGLSIINADYSSTSFRVSRASIGSNNFLGNNIAYPSGARTGKNCLLATKVMVPLEGEVREGWACSAHRASRFPGRSSAIPGSTICAPATSCAATSPRRTATTPARWSSSCSCGGCTSSCSRCSAWRTPSCTTPTGMC